MNSKKPVLLHSIKFKNGSTYSGYWMEGMRSGFGKLIWSGGGLYEGDWVSNFSEGKGKI